MKKTFAVVILVCASSSVNAFEPEEIPKETLAICSDLSQVAFDTALEQIYPPSKKTKHPQRAVDDPMLRKANFVRPPIPENLIKDAARGGAGAFGARGYDKKDGVGYGLFSAHGSAISIYERCLLGMLGRYPD